MLIPAPPLLTAKDAFALKFPNFQYTGPLRAVMPIVPVPKREVPKDIPYPDYANNGEDLSNIPAKWANSRIPGSAALSKAEEVFKTIKYGLGDLA